MVSLTARKIDIGQSELVSFIRTARVPEGINARIVTLDDTYGVGERFSLTIEYSGVTHTVWVGEQSGIPLVATHSEPW